MLCARCESIVSESGDAGPRVAHRTIFGLHRLRGLTCERCGLVLPRVDSTDSLLDKLSQLAGFGLSAEGRPILEPSHESD